MLSQESNHQDQCQGGSDAGLGHGRALEELPPSPKIILQIHELIHPVKTPGRGSLGELIIFYDFASVILNDCEIILIVSFLV